MSGHGPPDRPERPASETTGIQVDAYGVRTSVRPSPSNEPEPRSWREVAQRVNSFLMGISVGVFGLLHDTVAGARALVRGVSRLPEHLNRRLIRTHAEADAAEHARQVALVGSSQNVPAFSEAGEHLLAELRALQAKGVDVRIEQAADGQIIISLVSAEHRSLALVEAKKLLLAFPSRPGDTGSEEQRRPGDPEAPRG